MSKSSSKKRLDELLAERGLVSSRSQAKGFVLAGRVKVEGKPVCKPGTRFPDDVNVELTEVQKYVSRGGEKLAPVFETLGLSVEGKRVMDIGCSTGGFTDFLLQQGAGEVWAIDVGYGVLDYRLRRDSRVVLLEKTNFRTWTPPAGQTWSFITADLSFISLTLVMDKIYSCCASGGIAMLLVKPQFEAARDQVGKKGVIKDPLVQKQAVDRVRSAAVRAGFVDRDVLPAGITGKTGNREFFICLEKRLE